MRQTSPSRPFLALTRSMELAGDGRPGSCAVSKLGSMERQLVEVGELLTLFCASWMSTYGTGQVMFQNNPLSGALFLAPNWLGGYRQRAFCGHAAQLLRCIRLDLDREMAPRRCRTA